MAADVDNVLGGPADLELDGNSCGHTQGGITVTITPENHAVTVDRYGNSPMRFRHVGDQVRVRAAFAEWIAATITTVYAAARDQSGSGNYVGIGRSAGFEYPDKELEVIPFLTADANKKILMWRAVPVGEIAINFNPTDDRILEVEFACLGDESKTDGEIFGQITMAAPPPPETV